MTTEAELEFEGQTRDYILVDRCISYIDIEKYSLCYIDDADVELDADIDGNIKTFDVVNNEIQLYSESCAGRSEYYHGSDGMFYQIYRGSLPTVPGT